MSRREAKTSASRLVTARPTPATHISATSVMHALSHIMLMGGDITEATDEPASWTTSPTAPSARPLVWTPTATAGAAAAAAVAEALAMSPMPVMGVDAAAATTRHVKPNASATAAHRPRRDQRAIWAATGVGTVGTISAGTKRRLSNAKVELQLGQCQHR